MMRIITGSAKGKKLVSLEGDATRPTSERIKEAVFSSIQFDVEGRKVLDLFAGSGALSLEALSRGASFAVLADNDRNASETQKRNIALLRWQERTRQFRCDWRAALSELQKENEVFDLIFLDPPYAMQDLRDVFLYLVPVTGPDTLVILEHEAGTKPQVPERFKTVRDRAWGFCSVTIYQLKEEGA